MCPQSLQWQLPQHEPAGLPGVVEPACTGTGV